MFDFKAARHHMVESQIRTSDVTDLKVIKAFRHFSRENFVPKVHRALAYGDAHIDLGSGRVMIRPRDFAKMVQAAKIVSSDIVLDIACGRGYSTAILAQLSDTVVGLESNEADVARATDILIDAEVTNAAVVQGNLRDGAAKHGPFDVIFVNGAIPEIPEIWTNQLAENGRLVCLIQSGPIGQVRVYTKISNTIGETIVFDASAPTIPGFEKEEVFDF